MINKKLNILISAHELSPIQGSECAVGWNVISRLGKYHNITVLHATGSHFCKDSYVKAINDYFIKNTNIYNIKFIPVEQSSLYKYIAKLNKLISPKRSSIGNPILYYFAYSLWERKAYKIAKDLHKTSRFHIAHHLTSVTFKEPGFLWQLDIPFIWGPTGGMRSIPPSFYKFLGLKYTFIELFRVILNRTLFYTNPRINNVIKRSALIYLFSPEDLQIFAKKRSFNTKLLLDTAATKNSKIPKLEDSQNETISAVWCGSLMKRKALEIILLAISKNETIKNKLNLKIIGTGPLENKYKSLCKILSIEDNIQWLGNVEHNKVFEIMSQSDFLIHSSLSEATSTVIPEALSFGLPIICHDISGMSIIVDKSCGIKIPLISPKESIKGFGLAIQRLLLDTTLLAKLKKGAADRTIDFSWDSMVKCISDDYLRIHEEFEL